ncbi:MAG: 3-oxoacyl-ACP synthase, partial [Proteobacteria bacterium]|nr:3-oxoacyl-ACP synthase [Pseudomonadota bacterium]
ALVESKRADHVLVAGADKLSTITNWDDRETCFLFRS